MTFAARVLERTGQALDSIPLGTPEDLQGGQIICRRTTATDQADQYIVTHGYPDDTDADGTQFWTRPESYRRVTL